MRRGWGVVGAGLLGLLLVAPRAHAFDDAAAVRIISRARTQLAGTVGMLSSTSSPKAAKPDGTWTTVSSTDAVGWTQGFFPGSLWLMFEVGKEPLWQSRAERWTRPLEGQKTNRQTHDLGFKLMLSYGHAYRLTGNPAYRDVLLTAAGSLAARFNAKAGIIDCCDWNPDWKLPMVIDTMMNLELLLWGAQNGGSPAWREMALRHALTTLRDGVRPDGGTFHVVDYEPATGAVRWRGTFQGASDRSTWSRGQAWAIYGYTMVYRYTRDARMLEAARRTAAYYLDRLPADGVPNWDFDSSIEKKDSSAAAAVASALLELGGFVTDDAERTRYRTAALQMLDSLASPAYLTSSASNSPGLLLHAVGHLPAGKEVDTSLIYGDYYLLEAVLRFNPRPPYPWYSKTSFRRGTHLLGSRNTGLRQMEFEVTPLRTLLDGVIAYADSASTLSGYSSFSMLVRLNSAGFFDVRNGGRYGALVRVPYARGKRYRVRMVADVPARRYSVWVRPDGGAEVKLADRFAFRSDAPFLDDVGKAAVRSDSEDSELKVVNHRVSTASATPLSDTADAPLSAWEEGPPEARAPFESGDEAAAAPEPEPEDALEPAGCSSAAVGSPVAPGVLLLLGGVSRRRAARRRSLPYSR